MLHPPPIVDPHEQDVLRPHDGPPPEKNFICDDSNIKVLFVDDAFLELGRQHAPSPGPDDRRVSLRSASSGPIDIAAMANTDHLDHQAGVDHLVQDPVVANAHSVHGLLTCDSDAARGPRLVGQQIYRGSNPVLLLARQPGDRLDRPAGDLDGVPAHSSPSAALTSSQGT